MCIASKIQDQDTDTALPYLTMTHQFHVNLKGERDAPPCRYRSTNQAVENDDSPRLKQRDSLTYSDGRPTATGGDAGVRQEKSGL